MFGKISYLDPKKEEKPKQKQNPLPKTKIIEKKVNKSKNNNSFTKNIQASLQGAKFRVLNEMLYTQSSKDALKYFQEHQGDFQLYHDGFRQQAAKWQENPLHSIIRYLKKHYHDKSKLILDLGCGEGELHEKMSKFANVRSFDLIAKKQFVQVADISNLPVQDKSADACVFCLSLMGTNYIDFIYQANRVLKESGELLIAQVESRCKEWDNFVKMIESMGFQCQANKSNSYFRLLYFKINTANKRKLKIQKQTKNIKQYSQQILKSCIYKKR